MKITGASAVVVAALAAACAFNPPPVPVEGGPADIEALVGDWRGEYYGETTGRSGSIEFELMAGEDHAHGSVLMTPRGGRGPYAVWRDPFDDPDRPGASEVLTIKFVSAERGEVTGVLDPYLDPDCQCQALTRFRGRQRGDVIEGTYTTRTARSAEPDRGVWKVRRVRG
jgi:hypothetical protein